MSPKLRFLLAGTFRILCCWCLVVSKERIKQKIYFNALIKKNYVKFGSLKHGFGIDVTLLIFNHSLARGCIFQHQALAKSIHVFSSLALARERVDQEGGG